ncbi:MAG: hypothetical protein J6W80_06965 [Kiritimatiellae bacterium]|nr:hypothetical protein [Kiritimatiellia bacterium]
MGGSGSTRVAQAPEETVTPAVARDISRDTESAQAAQKQARSRLRGIRSTYSRFTSGQTAGQNGASSKLG